MMHCMIVVFWNVITFAYLIFPYIVFDDKGDFPYINFQLF